MSQPQAHGSEADDEEHEFFEPAEQLNVLYHDEDPLGGGEDDENDENDPDYHDDDDGDVFHDAENHQPYAFFVEEAEGEEEEDGDEEDGDEDDEDEDEDEDEDADENGDVEDDDGNGQGTAEAGRRRPAYLTHHQLIVLLRGHDLGHELFHDLDDDDIGFLRRRRRQRPDPNRFPKVPSDEGRELMESGLFGSSERIMYPEEVPNKRLAMRILNRELGLGAGRRDDVNSRKLNQDLMVQSLIPTTDTDMTIRYDDPVYSGQFSDDGNFFFSVVKDFRVRMYDTSNPYDWTHYKTVLYPFGSWTLTDASLSPDNKWLAYTSIQPSVCLAPTDPNDKGDPYTLDLSDQGGTGRVHGWHNSYRSFGIWSVRFSGDGRELVAGTNVSSIVVFDIESRRVLHSVTGHEDDVNAVCFADKLSPHILYSGSDDATIKVWDRRSMGDGREAGAFVGHCEGLTYIDSKGDGRYILSNSKDQTMKLWDLRMAMSTEQFALRNPTQHTQHSDFDYRWNDYDEDDWFRHPDDNSLVTFRGHRVQRTLIRCHFSPPGSTNSRYVYSGSHDGKVYVWNLDATIAAVIDVRNATSRMHAEPGPRPRRPAPAYPRWSTCVREAHWHPNAPVLVASAWNGTNMDFGTCTLHSFNDPREVGNELSVGPVLNEKLAPYHAPPLNDDMVRDLLWEDETF